MPHLSLAEKVRVVTLLEEGWLERRVAVRFNIARSTVHNKKMWNERQSFERQVGSGRPRVSTEIDDVNLIQVLRENPFNSVTEAHNETNFPGALLFEQQGVVSRKDRNCEIILQSKNLF
jgi:transposase